MRPMSALSLFSMVSRLPLCILHTGSQTSVYAATQPLSTTGYYYFHPYWGCFDWLLPFEVMGPFNGWTAAIPRLPRHANQVAQDLWDLTEREIASHEKKD